jgi:hypothetical protein
VPERPGGRHALAATAAPVPAVPVIRKRELYYGSPYPLLDGTNPTIGWQAQPEAKGGVTFVLISRTLLGSLKVLEHFPPTEDGWAQAWQALIKANPDAAGRIRAKLIARAAEAGLSAEIADLDARSIACLSDVPYLGGYGAEAAISAGDHCDVRFLEDRLVVVPHRKATVLAEIPYGDVEALEVGGPGLIQSMSPGQQAAMVAAFGLVGGLVAYGSTKIKTAIRVQAARCELFFLHARTEPDALRIELSPGFGAIRDAQATRAQLAEPTNTKRPASPVEELTKLAGMLDRGLLTREEFDHLKSRLLADS